MKNITKTFICESMGVCPNQIKSFLNINSNILLQFDQENRDINGLEHDDNEYVFLRKGNYSEVYDFIKANDINEAKAKMIKQLSKGGNNEKHN